MLKPAITYFSKFVILPSNKRLDDKALDMVDVISLNFYYGWYSQSGNLAEAENNHDITLSC